MIESIDNLKVQVLTANTTDVTLRSDPYFKSKVIQPGAAAVDCLAEHGLSFSLTTLRGKEIHNYLFDMGGRKATIINNLTALKIAPSIFEKVFLSHGHYDHWGAIIEISKLLPDGTEFILNSIGLLPRYSLTKELTGVEIDPSTMDFEKLKSEKKIRQLPEFPEKIFKELAKEKKFKLNFTDQPVEVESGVLTSGEITIFDFDEVTKGMLVQKGGRYIKDTFRDELSLYVGIKNKGLVVLTGCGHNGLINTIKHGIKLTGISKIYAIIGGLHQNWASIERIRKTVRFIKEKFNPELICGLHCTGFKFIAECMHQMPNQTVLGVVGTTFFL
ncbi:MAG: MBL fold metallo-hydrolase [Promethearchaeota archaeon]